VGRKSKIVLGVAAAFALLWVLSDWNWFRPALERYLSAGAGREIRADHLSVALGFSLEPTVTLRGLYIQNAPWADTQQPMAVAGEASFTFSLRSVWEDRPVVSRIVLKDAQVDMQRQANGLRNWRLKNPDYRGPAKIKVLRLEAYRSTLRFADRGLDFDIRFASSPLEPVAVSPQSGKPLTQKIDIKGVYRGADFNAQAMTGDVFTFLETRQYFPVSGHVIAGKTRLDLDGMAADMFRRPLLEANVRIAGPTLSQLHPFILLRPAVSRPYSVEAQVDKTEDEYRFTRLRGKIGETDLTGDAAHDLRNERAFWRADLKSESANLFDLRSLAGVNYPAESLAGAAATQADSVANPPDRLFPRHAFNPDHFRTYDAHISLDAKKLKAPGMPALESLRFTAALQDGVLQLEPVDFGIAGGHARGRGTLDARKLLPSSRAVLELHDLSLERLFPKLPAPASRIGALKGKLQFEGSGESVAAVLGGASGKLEVELEGGSISNLLDAKLSLNLGKIAGLTLRGDRDIPIRCGMAAFDFHNGYGKSRVLLVETAQTRIEGTGAIYLRDERLDLLLTPRPNNPGLLTLGSAIHVRGSLKRPEFTFDKGAARAPEPLSNAHCAAGAALPAAGPGTAARSGVSIRAAS
jgi:AsmA family protein